MSWNANESTIKLHRACTEKDLDTDNNLMRLDKEKIDVKQLDEMKTLLKTLGTTEMFGSMERLQKEMKNDPQVEIVKMLCEIGFDLHQKDYKYNGTTALYQVCRGTKATSFYWWCCQMPCQSKND